MSNTEEDNKIEESLKPFYKLALLIISAWGLSFVIIYFLIEDWTNRGIFGDMFGAINSLFSGLALAGIIYTIFLQRKELRLQRLELSETRMELRRSASAQEKSEHALKEQAKSLKQSSQLTALNSLVSTYTDQEQYWTGKHAGNMNSAKMNKQKYINEIERILRTIK